MRILGVDPGSQCTGYGCIDTSGNRHSVVACGALTAPAGIPFSEKLLTIHRGLSALLVRHQPSVVAIENVFCAKNARSALILGHLRGVLMLAASEADIAISEYSPTEVKRAVVGYGRAEKRQVQQMVTLILGMDTPPSPLDVSDALAVAVCHAHSIGPTQGLPDGSGRSVRNWRRYVPRERVK